MNKNDLSKIKIILLFFLAYTFVFLGFFGTLKLTLPFVIAGLTSYILKEPTRYLINKFNMNKNIATIISITLFYILSLAILTVIVMGLINETSNIISSIKPDVLLDGINKINKEFLIFYDKLNPYITKNISTITSSLSSWILSCSKYMLNGTMGLAKNIPYLFTTIGFAIIATFFMLRNTIENKYSNIPFKSTKYYDLIKTTFKMIIKYCISFTTVVFLSFLQLLILLLICRVPNALLISIISALLDVLPIVGMALLIVPIGIYYIITGAYFKGIVILVGYVLVCLVRQIIEPKIMSTALNITPLQSLMCIFIGLNLAGIIGMIYFIFLIVCFNIFKDKFNL